MKILTITLLILISANVEASSKDSTELWNLFNEKYRIVDTSLQMYLLNFPREQRQSKMITDIKLKNNLTEKIKAEFITKLEAQFSEKEIQYFNTLFRNKSVEKFDIFTRNFGGDIGSIVVKDNMLKSQK